MILFFWVKDSIGATFTEVLFAKGNRLALGKVDYD
jgi:hypothetical protein